MKDYIICTDVSCDLDADIALKNNVVFIPMQYSIDGEMFMCTGVDDKEVIRKFYLAQRKGVETKTTQITPFLYEDFITPYLEKGISVLYLALSSGLSNTYNSASLAANNLKEDFPDAEFVVIDSKQATAAMGILVERMIRNKNNGLDIYQNKADIEEATTRVAAEFMVKDLMYLKRGGRVSAAAAAIGTMLDLRPILIIDREGKLSTIDKKRGDNGSVRYLINRFKDNFDENEDHVLYIGGSDSDELQDYLEEMVKEEGIDLKFRRVSLSPIIGAHTGPGMVFMVYMKKN